MNQQCHRVVFNANRGLYMAVAEIVSAHQGRTTRRVRSSRQPTLCGTVLSLSLLTTSLVQAQIVVDAAAPAQQRAAVAQADNGVALINIAPPSTQGVSHNVFQQFDVLPSGAILNNARSDSRTQLGGWVPGNARLTQGSASIILNEVNSTNPTHLKGFMEVAGAKAQVVVANPMGISCDGCGFINASRATLTTGQPLMARGNLDGFLVRGGSVLVTGGGLNGLQADYTDIITRSLEVNAGIWAKGLNVVTGLNRVGVDASVISPALQADEATDLAPAFAIDTAQLGGMYAGHIRLLATEEGVGVRHHGVMGATAADVRIHADGTLHNAGVIQAARDVHITADGLDQRGGAFTHAQRDLTVAVAHDIDNSMGSTLSAERHVSLSARHVLNQQGTISAGFGPEGQGTVRGDMAIQLRGGLLNDEGLMTATGDIAINAIAPVNSFLDHANAGYPFMPWWGLMPYGIEASIQSFRGSMMAGGFLKIGVGDARENWRVLDYSQGTLVGHAGIDLRVGAISADDSIYAGGAYDADYNWIRNEFLGNSLLSTQGDLKVLAYRFGTEYVDGSWGGRIDASGAAEFQLACDKYYCGGGRLDFALTAGGGVKVSSESAEIEWSQEWSSQNNYYLWNYFWNYYNDNEDVSEKYVRWTGKLTVGWGATLRGSQVEFSSLLSLKNHGHIEGDVVSMAMRSAASACFSSEGLPACDEPGLEGMMSNAGSILANRIVINVDRFDNYILEGDGYPLVGVVVGRDSVDVAAHSVSVSSMGGYSSRTLAGKIISLGSLRIGGDLDDQGRAIGRAWRIDNHGGLIESAGEMWLSAAEISNTNGYYHDGLVEIGTPESITLVQPQGSTARVPVGNLRWQSWQRAGQYRYDTSPDPYEGVAPRLGQTPIPVPDQVTCLGDGDDTCTTVPGAQYLRGDPAWAYFNVSQPEPEPDAPAATAPLPPGLPQPVAPQPGASDEANQAYEQALATYQQAWATYEQQKLVHDETLAAYEQTRQTWLEQTADRYDELSDQIEAYNASFADDVIREWTQYDFTRRTFRTEVLASTPGRIIAGGNMTLDADAVLNDKSRIVAGGALVADLDRLENFDAMGQFIQRDEGTVRQTYTERRRNSPLGKKRTYREWTQRVEYLPPEDISLFPLGVGELTYGRAYTPSDVTVRPPADVPEVVPTVPPNVLQSEVWRQITAGLIEWASNPTSQFVLETNPRFTENRSWASSDVLLNALAFNGDDVLRRLGNGFIEQRFIREQVLTLTGQRYLGSYRNDEQQYLALMNAAATFAQRHQLRPGVALTAQQVAALTSDIVWLEEQLVSLPGGQQVKALVPRVYLAPRKGDLADSGALFGSALVGNTVDLRVAEQLFNSGGIAGREFTLIQAGDVVNDGGSITGGAVLVQSQQDIINRGGTIAGRDAVVLDAQRDVVLETTTQHAQKDGLALRRPLLSLMLTIPGNPEEYTSGQSRPPSSPVALPAPSRPVVATYEKTAIDRMAGVYVTGRDGVLMASAGQDLSVIGARLRSQGDLLLQAGGDVQLATVQTGGSQSIRWDSKRSLSESWTQDVGASLQARNDIAIASGAGVSARGAEILADLGSLEATAAGNITLEAAESTESFDERRHKTDKGSFSKTRTTTRDTYDATQALGTSLSADEVLLQSGQDVVMVGSSVVSTRGVTVVAQGDVRLDAAQESLAETHQKQTKKSGVFSGGGLGITMGSQTRSDRASDAGELAEASTLGSLSGDVTVVAGGRYSQTGSDLMAPSGDVRISAAEVDVVDARQLSRSELETRFKQSGLTLSLNNAVTDGLQTHQRVQEARGQTQDSRTQALATITQVLNAGQMLGAVQQDKATDISVSLMLGSSQSQSTTRNTGDTTRGSTVAAGQDISVQATGVEGEAGSGDLLVRGSRIVAQGDVVLSAHDALTLQAAQDRYSERSENKSSSAAVGVKIGSEGMGFSASGSVGRGRGDGDDVVQVNTQVQAGQTVGMSSGGDTTLQGAVVQGQQVQAHVGGDLTVQSLQDTSTYSSRQQNVGGSVTVGAGAGGSASYSSSKVNSDYASVVQRSGIEAGDGGFQVNVQGQTTLQGGVIASTDEAVDEGRNSLNTQGLSLSDIDNRASYEAKAVSVSVGTSAGQNSAGIGQASDSAASTTTAGVSGLAGDQSVRTGDASQGLDRIFDREGVTQDVTAQATVMAEFGKQASKAVGDYAQNRMKPVDEARERLALEQGRQSGQLTPEQARRLEKLDSQGMTVDQAHANLQDAQLLADHEAWKEGGAMRVAAHIAVGALGGGAAGAAGAGVSAASVPVFADSIDALKLPEPIREAVVLATGVALGLMTGGELGAASGLNQTGNNYLTHEEAVRRAKLMEQRLACQDQSCATRVQAEIDKLNRLDAWRDQQIAAACESPSSALCSAWVADIKMAAASYQGKWSGHPLVNNERSSVLNDAFKYQQANNNPMWHGVGKGLLKLSPPGLVVGTGVGGYALVSAIIENGAIDTAIQIAQGIKDLPAELKARLNSTDPMVRGEALVDTIGLAAGAATITTKLASSGYGAVVAQAEVNAAKQAALAAQARARVENNVFRDGSIAAPDKTMSPTGPWKPAQMLSPAEADARVQSLLPPGAIVTSKESADALNAAILKENVNFKPPYIANTEAVIFKTSQPTDFVRVYVEGGRSGQADTWVMPAAEVKGLSAEQIASKYALPQVPTHITDVKVPAGVQMRATSAGDINIFPSSSLGGNGGGGGVQFEVLSKPAKLSDFERWFTNARPLK